MTSQTEPPGPVITVSDLLRSPALQLSVEVASAGLERAVAWAHVCELEDPTPWLMGAELIMTTGIAVPRSADRQRSYIERLDEAGVSALALSEGLHVPPLTQSFRDAALDCKMPVLRVPLPVPFIAIAQEVAATVQSETYRRLTAQLHVFGALRTLAAEDLSPQQLFARLERLSGYQIFVCGPNRRALLPGVPAPPAELIDLIPASFDSPPAVPNGYVLPVPSPEGAAGFLLALEQPSSTPAGLAVVQHITTVAGLQLSIHRHEQETLRRQGAETLAELIQGVLDPATSSRRLARFGYDVGTDVKLAVLRARTSSPIDDSDIGRLLASIGGPALALRQHADLVVLVPETVDMSIALVDVAEVAVGVSRNFVLGEPLAVPRREALWALARALDTGRPVEYFGQDAAGRWLAEDPQSLRSLVDGVIGSVLAYDSAHDGNIVPSVRTWLDLDRQTRDAANVLHIHPNTLAYRIRRFEQLSNRSLRSTADLVEVWLAIHAVAHTRGLP